MVRRRDEERYVLYDELLSSIERYCFYALFSEHRHERRRRQQSSSDFQEQVRQHCLQIQNVFWIGDDEHGWDDNGVFNFEGGCYAKVINLDKESEPDIFNAIKRNALLENVTLDANGKIDFDDKSVTENTRVSYPIDHIEKIVRPVSAAPAAKNVIFLSADAFGVLPPVSVLTPEQTEYYFLSGFTAKLAGTERGITEPTPTFSACFGQAFLELHPTKYAEELVKKMKANGAKAYLVNTGWNGTGKRISIKDTRGIIDAILNGDIEKAPTKKIHTSTSKYLQNFRELIQIFLIHVILMQMLQSGKKKQKILQEDSLRTSQNMKAMR